LQQNPDVAASGVNPLLHYLLDGFREGREPSPEFSGRLYLEQNADVAASGMNPLGHFLKYGRSEGIAVPISGHCTEAVLRQLLDSGLFDPAFYLAQYPDVAEAGIDPLSHYLSHGVVEGWRKPNLYFDTAFYLQQNPDVAASGVNPLLHYLLDGFREGREPSPEFSGRLYLEQNPDVADTGMNPLSHFLKFGIAEGRRVAAPQPCTAEAEPAMTGEAAAVPGDPCGRAELILQGRDGVRRLLVIDYAVPTPDMDSGSVRMFGLLRLIIGFGSPLTFASHRLENNVSHIEAVKKLGVKVLVGYTEIRAHLEKWGSGYTLAILSRPETAAVYMPLVRAYAPYAEVVYDSVDLHHLRFRRAAELKNDPQLERQAELCLQLETLGFTFADRSLAITETEKQAILQKWPEAVVEVVPNVHSVRISPMPWVARKGLLFIGGYDHEPNVDAVIWFVQEVFPKVLEQIPDVPFTILGSRPPESVKQLASKNVNVVGWVPDPEPYFEIRRVFVAPLRYGAGMKGKIGQAMSLGLPVVTTKIGAEGMQLADGAHALIADGVDAFSTAVARLHDDEVLWTSLQRAAAAHIERNFSDGVVRNILRRLCAGEIASAKAASEVTA
jgi:glycosyltransferase involved in cell wall biosynthesis